MALSRIIAAWRRWRQYRAAYRQIAGLDRRELDDLGIGAWQFETLARRASGGTP